MTLRRLILACPAAAVVACGGAPCDPAGGVVCTIGGNAVNGYGGDGGDALDASLSLPQDVVLAPDGALLVLDWNNHRVRAITPDGLIVHVSGSGQIGGDPTDPAGAEDSDFHHPTDMLLAPDGASLVVAAWHNNRVREVALDSGAIREVAGNGDYGYAGEDGPAVDATLELPTSLAWSPDGELVIMDQANQVIRRVDAAGDIHRLAGVCIIDRPGGCSGAPLMTCPESDKLTCDPFVCDAPCATGFAADGTAAAELRMAQPFDLPGGRMVYDAAGDLVFADPGNHLVRRLDPDGVVTTVAGTPPSGGEVQSGYAGDGGPATEALLDNPVDLALAGDGTLYVADVGNHCIRAVDPAGTITTVAGTCGEKGYAGDGGPATEARFNLPYGIDVAGDRLYIADMGNSVIREVGLE